MGAKIKITQVKSIVGEKEKRRNTLRALGLKRIGDSVEKEEKPEILGMVKKVHDLVKVEKQKTKSSS